MLAIFSSSGATGAVSTAVRRRADDGAQRVVIAHGDLPFAAALADFADADGDEVLAVMDRHGRGTNVLSLPTGTEFDFCYGDGSFELHRAEAARCGLRWRVVDREHLQWDVDSPDLARFDAADRTGMEALCAVFMRAADAH